MIQYKDIKELFKPSRILLYFDIGLELNYKFLSNNKFVRLNTIPFNEYKFDKDLTEILANPNKRVLIEYTNRGILDYFLYNALQMDILFVSSNLKEWVFQNYQENNYCYDYITMQYQDFEDIQQLLYMYPPVAANKIITTIPENPEETYNRFFNIKPKK